jgi:hypothetical protein
VNNRFVNLLGIILIVTLLASTVPPVHAQDINFAANDCQRDGASDPSIFTVNLNGVVNVAPTANLFVDCSVPRGPLAATATIASFFIDGDNFVTGSSTTCVLASFDYTGTLLGSVSVTSALLHYDMLVSLPVAQASFFAYVSVFCSIPPAGRLRGMTSMQ